MKRHKKPFTHILFIVIFLCQSASYTQQLSNYFKHFVRHYDSEWVRYTPPEASFIVWLNDNQDKILLENAPRYESGAEPNIPGDGTFGVELSNFDEPELKASDIVHVIFTCTATREQGTMRDSVIKIPYFSFPKKLVLEKTTFPNAPENLQLVINDHGERILQWDYTEGISYMVYKRSLDDTLSSGAQRMLYTQIADNITEGSFTDTQYSETAQAYVVIPVLDSIWGAHSAEVTDFPATVTGFGGACFSLQPPAIGLFWNSEETSLSYNIYRDTSKTFSCTEDILIAETDRNKITDSNIDIGSDYYYRIVAVNQAGIKSAPTQSIKVTTEIKPEAKPDPDVLFISRTPRYRRYEVAFDPPGYNPHQTAETEDLKHYPAENEMMTYTAVIRNSGGVLSTNTEVVWSVDGNEIATAMIDSLFPKERYITSIQHPYSGEGQIVTCALHVPDNENEISKKNNSRTIRSNGIALHFYAEKNILDLFESRKNPYGSYSFEDWAQYHIAKLNEYFREAVYPGLTPNGVDEWVFLDTVSYRENGLLPAGGTHAPVSWNWDGVWGFTGDDNALNYFGNIVLGENNGTDWALLHELGHQLGLIDLYNQDTHIPQMQVIEPRTGKTPALEPVAWEALFYSSRSNHLMHSNYQNGFSDHSAGALHKNRGKRRGFFGEYLEDIPKENYLKMVRTNGTPIKNADIAIYQKQDGLVPNTPKFRGKTDANGIWQYPHTTDSLYHGGMFALSPFSSNYSQHPHVVGTNATLFIRIATADSVGYTFMDICDYNVEYWKGNTDSAMYKVKVDDWFYLPITGVEPDENNNPMEYALGQNYPNPFNPVTTVPFSIKKDGFVTITLYNILGKQVKTLINEWKPKGNYTLSFHAGDLNTGVYFYRIISGDFTSTKKMILLK